MSEQEQVREKPTTYQAIGEIIQIVGLFDDEADRSEILKRVGSVFRPERSGPVGYVSVRDPEPVPDRDFFIGGNSAEDKSPG